MSLLGLIGSFGGGDKTPDAVNWANISFTAPDQGANANQTIQGITAAITLTVSWSGTAGLTLEYDLNGAGFVSISNGGSVGVTNGQTLRFNAVRATAGSNTVSVTNLSDGSALLDQFTVTAS